MKRLSMLTLFVILTAGRSLAADVTVAELMQAAIELGRQSNWGGNTTPITPTRIPFPWQRSTPRMVS